MLVNKNDDGASEEDVEALRELLAGEWSPLPISVMTGRNLERLKPAVGA